MTDLICGISKIWALPESHWAHTACVIHDREYLRKDQGSQSKSRKQVDTEFLANMLQMANSFRERLEAKFLYRIVRLFGGLWW